MENKELKKLHGLLSSASCSAQRIEELARLMMDRGGDDDSYMDDRDMKDIAQTSEMLRDIYAETVSIAKKGE